MVLALALCASTAVNENTPHEDVEPLYHDERAQRPDKRLGLRFPPSPRGWGQGSGRDREDRLQHRIADEAGRA